MAMLNGNGSRGVQPTREAANAIPGRRPNGHVAIVGIPDNPPTTGNYVNYIAFRGTGHTYCPDSCGCPTELISGEYPECDIRYCRCPDQCACNCCQGCADRANSEMEFTC